MTDQQGALHKLINSPRPIAKAAEGSMKKRQAMIDEVDIRKGILHILVKHEFNLDMNDEGDMKLVIDRPDVYHRLSLMTSRPSTIELIDMMQAFIQQRDEQREREIRIDELKILPVNWESCYDNTLRKHYSKVYDDVYDKRLAELTDQTQDKEIK